MHVCVVRDLLSGALCALFASLHVHAQQDPPQTIDQSVQANILMPARLPASDQNVERLNVPAGFRIEKFAENLGNTREIAIRDDGTVYVTRRNQGDCLMLRDVDGDGKAEFMRIVAQRPHLHGIAIRNNQMYLATVRELYVASINDDGTLGELVLLIDDLPDGGQHPNRTMKFGPDGMLYISIGSTCNACEETNPEHASLLQVKPDGSSRRIYASGLRNTFGFDWHPQTDELWGMDHGMDWLGDNAQHEELNRIIEGGHYGWPYIYDDGKRTPHRSPTHVTFEEFASLAIDPALLYTPHAAAMQMSFYDADQFPAEYRGDAFVTMRGSWNRRPPSGYEVVRIRFDDNGQPVAFEPFITGWLVEQEDGSYAHFGRLVGLAIAPNGSLMFCDDTNGVIYRVTYDSRSADPQAQSDTTPEADHDAVLPVADQP